MTNVPQKRTLVNEEFQAVQDGNLNSPSAWDGWSLTAIFDHLSTRMLTDAAANLVDAIMQNRIYYFREGLATVADKLDVALVAVPAYELWPEIAYFEDEVRS